MHNPKVLGHKDAARLLGISKQRFNYLITRYEIPHQKTSGGRVFFEHDILAFQEGRKNELKHCRKNP
ncbi:MAG: helix-turn-helix domain-containing protein [Flavobacteriaceae bacterium]|nr:MAG: helix-turn-helix domain-containing protein [Flavobacteriaceae bacterium]